MKIVVFGAKSTTRLLFNHLVDLGTNPGIVTISAPLAERNFVADFDDLSDLEPGADFYYVAESYSLKSEKDQEFFAKLKGCAGFVAGWQRIIPDFVLDTFEAGVFGMHGSSKDLPFGRGRSPINWSIIEGRRWFFTNLFKYEPGVDDGPIVEKSVFSINIEDTAETLHYKNISAMKHLVSRNIKMIVACQIQTTPQGEGEPTYYPKRSPEDSILDWLQDIYSLSRHIRAVTRPFNGAFSYIDNQFVRIWRAGIFYTDIEDHPFVDQSAGTICEVFPNGKFLVATVGGVLIVHDYESAIPLEKGQTFVSPADLIRQFPVNLTGGFDN